MCLTRQDAFWLTETLVQFVPQAFSTGRQLSSLALDRGASYFYVRTALFEKLDEYSLPPEAERQLWFDLAICKRFMLHRVMFTADFEFSFYLAFTVYGGHLFCVVEGHPSEEVRLCV